MIRSLCCSSPSALAPHPACRHPEPFERSTQQPTRGRPTSSVTLTSRTNPASTAATSWLPLAPSTCRSGRALKQCHPRASRSEVQTDRVGRRVVIVGSSVAVTAVVGLAAVGAVAAAMLRRGDRQGAQQATRQGMKLFTQGDVEGSLREFDRALELDPSQRPYLWQRGLSLYYANQFEEGAKQFRDDVAVNPNDTEEAIWAFLCEAQLTSAEDARTKFLQVGRDPRPVMRAAYELFQSGVSTEQLEEAARADPGGHDAFYSNLYLGLFYESQKDEARARAAITEAVRTPYGTRSGDYMAQLAAVHCKCRGWAV